MPTNDIHLINDLEESLLSTIERSDIADFITHEACRTYYKIYKKKNIPASFIKFIFNEYKNYVNFSNQEIKKFFKFYKDSDIDMIVVNYQRNQLSVIKDRKIISDQIFYRINPSININLNFSDDEIYGYTNPELFKTLKTISNHINNNDELVSTKELYEKFMMREYLKSASSSNKSSTNKNTEAATKRSIQTDSSGKLKGKTVDMPKQSGKVSKLFFPRFNLPTTYPTPKTKSRINTPANISKLMKADDQIKFINQKQINGVKYSQKFIDKRIQLAKPTKKKFQFDF